MNMRNPQFDAFDGRNWLPAECHGVAGDKFQGKTVPVGHIIVHYSDYPGTKYDECVAIDSEKLAYLGRYSSKR